MPFELGLAVAHALNQRGRHAWFVFEARPHRLSKSLSDLAGTDPHIHDGKALGVLRSLANALSRNKKRPKLAELEKIYHDVEKAARQMKSNLHGGTLFEAAPFKELAVFAAIFARERVATLRKK